MKKLIRFQESFNFQSFLRTTRLLNSPIIIGGCARSGTTLLHAVLAAHPKIQPVLAESRIFKKHPYSFRFLNTIYHRLLILNHLVRYPVKPSAERWMEKTPQNVLYIENILREFKERVYVIHIIRDGRDVVTSRHPSLPGEYFVSPEHWVEQVTEGLKWKDHPRVITLKYEELIMDFEKTTRDILSLLALEWTEEVKDFQRHTPVQYPRSLKGRIEPVNSLSIGKWKEEVHEHRIHEFYQCRKAVTLLNILGYNN
ncbi:MAG TPA: hypothetical protein DCG19_04610 [Cryomorphaceae bacterium]|nr:hypothetical protein [Owenweeksia sp.]HAD96664.1 hypothetical protein [Cryomorphaceae bacterium]HBF18743.1 hypothetical protein [Cryomorphaceae bacterium]HCQ15589.1 hypothetical protein [Cryomorphaceae bacterium]